MLNPIILRHKMRETDRHPGRMWNMKKVCRPCLWQHSVFHQAGAGIQAGTHTPTCLDIKSHTSDCSPLDLQTNSLKHRDNGEKRVTSMNAYILWLLMYFDSQKHTPVHERPSEFSTDPSGHTHTSPSAVCTHAWSQTVPSSTHGVVSVDNGKQAS